MMRLAFWGRCSTEDRQDPRASREWQLSRALALVAPHRGQVVAEYFDVDASRSIPPQRRPEASRLLAELANPARVFEAVVVGEPQRAFYGNQFGNTFPLFEHYGVDLWVPEVGGPIDPANEAHDLIMSTFGSLSKGERNRIKTRVHTTMGVLVETQGRTMGGRAPYGYLRIDAGPHPNPSKAADGKRLSTFAIDPEPAAIVRRIYREYLNGSGRTVIADGLNKEAIPCPSANDRERNRHRSGAEWTKGAVHTILNNPRYTGREVWNRQGKREVLIDLNDITLGHTTKRHWNSEAEWIWSRQPAHPAIIPIEDYIRVQETRRIRPLAAANRRRRTTKWTYLFQGLILCKQCDRRMHGHRANNTYYYRCITRKDSPPGRTCRAYIREDAIRSVLDQWLAPLLADPNSQSRDTMSATEMLNAGKDKSLNSNTKRTLTREELLNLYSALALRLRYDAGTATLEVEQAVDRSTQRAFPARRPEYSGHVPG